MNKKLLCNLYNDEKLSMMEIAHKLNITHAKVNYWMKKYNIPRRTWSESAYIKQNPGGDPFKIKKELNKDERELFIAGLMLFWAEGSKGNKYSVQLANLDHRMLQLFVEFLQKICRINLDKLSLYVRLHKKFDKEKARIYWAKLLQLPEKQVFIYTHIDKRSKESKQWSPYGLATLEFHNTKLKRWLDSSIDEYLGKYLGPRK